MSKFILPLSLSLIASMSFSPIARAEFTPNTSVANEQSLCTEAIQKISSLNTPPSKQFELAEIILDSRPSYDSRCGDWYTTIKYDKVYECIKCEYGGPYCWRKH